MRRPLRWLAAAALCLAACTSPEERLAKHLERGEAYLREDRTSEALLEFQSALNLRPDDAALFARVGGVLYERGRFREALRYLQQASQLDPELLDASLLEARLLVETNPERAREIVDGALERAPDDPRVQRAHAHIAAHGDDFETALAAAERAIELDPDDPEAWIQLGTVYDLRIRHLRQRGQSPDDETYQAAVNAYLRADEIEGGDVPARLLATRVFVRWPHHQIFAEKGFESSLELARAHDDPAELALVGRAIDQYGQEVGSPRLRREGLREVVGAVPTDFASWEKLARLTGGREPARAEPVYIEMLEKAPLRHEPHVLYAGFLLRLGREEDAEAHVRTALGSVDDPHLWEWLLRLHVQQGRLADARADFVTLSERHPDAVATRTAQARLALAEGRTEDADRILRALAEEAPSVEHLRLRALAAQRLGRLDEADEAIDRALALSPDVNFPVARLKGRIAHERSDWVETVRAYRMVLGRGEELGDRDRVRLATALHRGGLRDDALPMFRELLARERPDAEAALAFAELEGEQQPDAVDAALHRALEAHPLHPELVEAVTRRDIAAGRVEPTLERLNGLLAAGAATPRLLLLRGEVLARSGALDEAEADVLRAFEANPGLPGATDLLYSIYRAQGRLDEARQSFEQAEQAGVLHPGARLLLARLYLAEGNRARAREMLEVVVEERPELWSARNDLAWLLAESGEDLERALALAREAYDASGGEPAAADTIGWIHLKAGRYEAGLTQFQHALRRSLQRGDRPSPTLVYHSGLALAGLGRDEQAARAFERALAAGEFPEAENARQQLEEARKRAAQPGDASPS